MTDPEKLIEGEGGFDYLIRSISIVTLLYERGILSEILESGRITEQEVETRTALIRKRFPAFDTAGKDGSDSVDDDQA